MNKRIFSILFGIFLVVQISSVLAQKDPNDCEGSKDIPLFSRMKGFYIDIYEENPFNKYEFAINSTKKENIEGHYYYAQYRANDNVTPPSGLQIVRNYTNAAKAIGGKQIFSFEDGGEENVIIKILKNNAEVWIHIGAWSNGTYFVYMVEKELMNQEIVADASSLVNSLKETGKVAVYGIYFDTDKSTLKPESAPSLEQIAKMLKENSNIKVYVVGHTDNAGTFDHNVKLSKERADSVIKELTTKYSVAAIRLQAFGSGPTAPVASNSTEDGKAKNRRVELVQQ
jgi:OmpA-OmpF porin, OOP family